MTESFDVAVIGGGPAGAIASLQLARLGWNVVVLEAGASDSDRCGETLPPEVNPLMQTLGLRNALERSDPIESPGIVSSWGSPYARQEDFLRNPYGPGWHVDRRRFDRELCVEAERVGVTVRYRCHVGQSDREGNWWHLKGLRARALVDATGLRGLRLSGTAQREVEDSLLVLVLTVSYPGGRPGELRTVIESVPSGWWYYAPVPDGGSVAMFFTGAAEYATARLLSHDELVQQAPLIRGLLNTARIVKSRWTSASSSIRKSLFGDGWVSAGDSASCYDPLAGRGIFKGLQQAVVAAQALDATLRGEPAGLDSYQVRVLADYRNYVNQRRRHYCAERRWPEHSFWLTRCIPLVP